jgi:hypothetical protein
MCPIVVYYESIKRELQRSPIPGLSCEDKARREKVLKKRGKKKKGKKK